MNEQMKIIVPVRELIDWVNSLVAFEKPDGTLPLSGSKTIK